MPGDLCLSYAPQRYLSPGTESISAAHQKGIADKAFACRAGLLGVHSAGRQADLPGAFAP